jgi:predicted lysophospholipase L1 biosynthesis ABC-type transport system permease subunit
VAPAWVFVTAVALGAAVVVVVVLLAGVRPYRAVRNADPGAVVRIGTTPLPRFATDLAALVCVGCLAFVVVLTAPRATGWSARGLGGVRGRGRPWDGHESAGVG